MRQRYSFQVLTSSKAVKIFVQPLLRDFVILPLKLLLCKSLFFFFFFKAVKAEQRSLSGEMPAGVVRGAGSPLGGIATLAVREGESGVGDWSPPAAGARIRAAIESVFIFSALVIYL